MTVYFIVELDTGDRIYLKSFQSHKLQEFIDFVKQHDLLHLDDEETLIHATGGGAYKYSELLEQSFDGRVKLRKHDEMQSLVDGM